MSRASFPPLPSLLSPLLCSLYAVISSRSWWRSELSCSAFSPSVRRPGQPMPGQARLGAGTGQVGAAGSGSETAESGLPWPGRQCVMVMLTCPTFVIHLCDNWDRCFHVHPQCVSNQDQRLVNTVRDPRRATSPDRTTSSVDHHTSAHCNCSLSLVWCDNNHQVGIFTTSSHQ